MFKRSVIGFDGLPDIAVRELIGRDLLDFEFGNEIFNEQWIFESMCGIKSELLNEDQKETIIVEFNRLNQPKDGDEKSNIKSSQVIAMLISYGHVNAMDYGITLIDAAIESILVKNGVKEYEKTEEELKENWNDLESIL